MNDYKEMGMIYEGFMRGNNPHVGHARDTSRAYPPAAAPLNKTMGRNLPFTGNGHGGAYDGAIASSSHVASDEEHEVDSSTFMRNDIIKKIDSLMADAESFEDVKTMLALNDLKRFVEEL